MINERNLAIKDVLDLNIDKEIYTPQKLFIKLIEKYYGPIINLEKI